MKLYHFIIFGNCEMESHTIFTKVTSDNIRMQILDPKLPISVINFTRKINIVM